MFRSSRFSLILVLLLECTAAAAGVPSRVVLQINDSDRTRFFGNTHPAALASNDEGPVDPDLQMQGVRLLLKRSTQQEAALESLMAQQSNPKSSNFHHWLTAAQFGTQFGPSDADVSAVTHWLGTQGLTVVSVNPGRTLVTIAGSAALIQEAFRVEMHRYLVNGREHIANNGDPSIPAALSPVVGGVASLNDFHSQPLHRDMGAVKRNRAGKWVQTAPNKIGSQFNVTGTGGFELMSPLDFAAIYNLLPLWNAGIDGTGQTIAIAGRSDINLNDVASFRAAFGLPVNTPQVIVNGADPGVPNLDEQEENTLDVEWSGAVAKGAQIIFVTTASTYGDGAEASAQYIIDNRIAPVMSFSYGLCELYLGASGNAAINAMWQQAAAEGISVFVASGDEGAAACDMGANSGTQQGLAVSGLASTPYNTAVGGTDFNWVNLPATTFWATGAPAFGASATQYIPEVPWNSTCASLAYNQALGVTASGEDPEQYCNWALTTGQNLYSIGVTGGGGGMSACTTPGSWSATSCGGGYPKPMWQTGTGVPPDGQRDVPDVSLFAANGLLGTAYVICDSALAPCNYSNANNAFAQAVGGTSVSSPAMAGIMTLVNQKMGAAQGNANVGLYALAARDNRANCNTVTVGAGNACNFYDITTDSNAVPCAAGSIDCTVLHAGDQLGILSGNRSSVGYDLATGLGTVNANNLVNNWHLTNTPTSSPNVPSVVGSTLTAATTSLNAVGLGLGTVTQQNSTTVNKGVVISESPIAGSSVALGTNVNLVVSSGPPILVPNEIGLMQSAAVASLNNAGMSVGTILQTPNGCDAAGTVIGQAPAAGTTVSTGASVNLTVAGVAPNVMLPNLSGVLLASASSALGKIGLNIGTVTQASSMQAVGYVIGQSPAAGSSAPACSSVSLTVSSGPAPVKVPNEVNVAASAASNAITSLRLLVGTVTQQTSSIVAQGFVISESPVAGTTVAVGSAVNLIVSSGKAPLTVPNEVGVSQTAATTTLRGLGFLVTSSQATSATIAAGNIISEKPSAGTAVSIGSTVALVVSSGRPLVQVPAETGATQAAALSSLTSKGLNEGAVTHQLSASVAVGKVISQKPLAGTTVAAGSAVTLVISSGAPVMVPNLAGLLEAAAAAELKTKGLTVGTVTERTSATVTAGKIMSELPAAGTAVAKGSTINLVVSHGKT
jgi:beta-lactam-binding protein with PASTA domain